MTPDELMDLIDYLCEARENSTAHRVMASYETNYDEQGVQRAQEQQWDEIGAHRLREVEKAIRSVVHAQATVEGFMPVRPMPGGNVELRAIDSTSMRVAVIFTGTEALNLGARLTACGAIAIDRIGLKAETELHPLAPGPAIGTSPVPPPVVPGPAAPAHRH